MSSLFNQASLVIEPVVYETSKVYATKPFDGSGDLSFSRSNDTATRVGPDGLIEKVRTNVALYSQDFSNAAWTKTNVTISTSATANPVDGQLTAQDVIPNTTSSAHRVLQDTGVVNSVNSWSIYAKANGYNFVAIVENGNTGANVSFNLSTGAVSTQNSAVGQIESLGGGWYRCTMIVTTATTPRFDVYIAPTDSLASYTGDGTSGVTLFGAQAEASDFGATDYIATTSAAVSVGPVANVPRLDYLGSSCPRLLLEPQRTNLLTYSEQFDNAAWLKYQVSVSANQAVSPDGYQNADKLTLSGGSGTYTGLIYAATTPAANSIYMKNDAIGSGKFYIQVDGVGNAAWNVDGTLSSVTGGTAVNGVNMGNGWFRFTYVCTGGTYVNYGIENGTTGSSIFIWGAQVEAGAYATSYIPTLGAAVTRGADAASKTGISSLIGQTEGTLFSDFVVNGLQNFGTPISVNDGTTDNYVWLTIFGNGTLRAEVYNSSGVQATIAYTGAVVGGRYKMAFGYKANDFVLYVNGALIGSSNSGTTFSGSTLSRLDFDITNPASFSVASESINQALLFKTRLSNADLAALTA